MSHFTVMIKIPKPDVALAMIEPLVRAALAPYQENNMDDCPNEYLEFHDQEDEFKNEYEAESVERVRLPNGELVLPWDERFRVPGTFGTGPRENHHVPDDCEKIQVPFRETYATLEDFAKEWHGHDARDEKAGRFGYWENPNKKWDWWQIGGRWTGFFPVKQNIEPMLGEPSLLRSATDKTPSHRADVCRVRDLDLDAIATETRVAAEKFWNEFATIRQTGRDSEFYGPRARALDLGLVVVLRDREPTPEERPFAFRWSDVNDRIDEERSGWWDVYSSIDRDTFLEKYIDSFCPIVSYAALDQDGWHEPGRMGWFGCSAATPDATLQFSREFVRRFIKTADPDDVLVVVDCHI